ncbi:hypothetical protein B0H13DRAFT_1850129 [Mycena leptocephala]|nr:hypothetical protein B0H13DRAFT_1850129 [Mycena leptocephala]
MDGLCNEETEIESTLLADPEFDLQRWYAEQRGKAIGLKGHIRVPSSKLEESLALGAQMALEEGILTYPGDNSEFLFDRFSVFQYEQTCHYWIWDKQHRWSVDLQRERLLDASFDLISWYRNGCAKHLTLGLESWMWYNELSDYIKLLNNGETDPTEDEWIPFPISSSLQQAVNSAGGMLYIERSKQGFEDH